MDQKSSEKERLKSKYMQTLTVLYFLNFYNQNVIIIK